MAIRKQAPRSTAKSTEQALRLSALQSPGVEESLERLRKRYGKYATTADDVRLMLDGALGERTLTEELRQSREK